MIGKTPILYAIIAAALFGASAPLAKLLLVGISPILLAALLYLGSGIGLLMYKLILRVGFKERTNDAAVDRHDLPWLIYATVAGGIAAPIALLVGLQHLPAATASLLLSFEGIATALIAGFFFREEINRRTWVAIAFVTIATILLSLDLTARWDISWGALGVLGACVLWGMDNNFTRNISGKDAVVIVIVKSLAAGLFNLALAMFVGDRFPGAGTVLLSCLLGLCCYGFSLVFFILSLRGLGAARTSAFFASAPFIGAALSVALFREPPTAAFVIALPIMAIGVYALFSERHAHYHTHHPTEHNHYHDHADEHHRHEHASAPAGRTHSHRHTHAPLTHDHPHAPDLHHRHEHRD